MAWQSNVGGGWPNDHTSHWDHGTPPQRNHHLAEVRDDEAEAWHGKRRPERIVEAVSAAATQAQGRGMPRVLQIWSADLQNWLIFTCCRIGPILSGSGSGSAASSSRCSRFARREPSAASRRSGTASRSSPENSGLAGGSSPANFYLTPRWILPAGLQPGESLPHSPVKFWKATG